MALHRNQLSAVDGFDDRIDWSALMERWNERAMRWVLGGGFLSLHLAAFTVSLLTALTWNLIVDPSDLWMVEPFRYWGVFAGAHTVLLGGGLILWKLLGRETETPRRFRIPATVSAPPRVRPDEERPSAWQSAWARPMESVARVNATARRWASSATRQPEPTPPPADTGGRWPEQPLITHEHMPDVGEATWPASAPLSTILSSATTNNPADEVVSVDHRGASDDHTRTWIDGFIESRSKDKENRWSWVEAAAAAWLNKREVEGTAEKALSSGEEESGAATSQPPDDANQSQNPSA
jgi:hypothetical protein